MAEYISRSELQSEITKGVEECRIKAFDPSVNCILQIIHNMPAADVQPPVVHGKWEEVEEYSGWGDTHYRCSVCGEELYLKDGTPQLNHMKFCPWCGFRMDLE